MPDPKQADPIPVTNDGAMPRYVAGVMIPPGETRHFPAHHVPAHLRPQAAPVPGPFVPENDPVSDILAGTVAEVSGAIPELGDPLLADLLRAEHAADKPRKGVLEAIAAEQMMRASQEINGQAGIGTGNEA